MVIIMDSEMSEHEKLRQQLQQLKSDLAKKERKLMKMERMAQARKLMSKMIAKENISSICNEANNSKEQNTSASSCTSANFSVSYSISDTEAVSGQKCDSPHSDFRYHSKSYEDSLCIHKHQTKCTATILYEEKLHKDRSRPEKIFPLFNVKDRSAAKVSGICEISDPPPLELDCSTVEKIATKLCVESDVVTEKHYMKHSSCDKGSSGIQADTFLRTECPELDVNIETEKCPSPLLVLPFAEPNWNKGKTSVPLRNGNFEIENFVSTEEISISEHKEIHAKQKSLGEFQEIKEAPVCDSFMYSGSHFQKECLLKDLVSNKAVRTDCQAILETAFIEQRTIATSEHPVNLNDLSSCADADYSEYPKKKSKLSIALQKNKDADNLPEEPESKIEESSSLAGGAVSEKTTEFCELKTNKAGKNLEQHAADKKCHSELRRSSSDGTVNTPPRSSPVSFRRSQRLAKQNYCVASEKKQSCVQRRSGCAIDNLFRQLLGNCKSNDICDFELPPEEFGLLMEIKVKNSNEDTWPPSPSESFEIITPDSFVPDSEEDRNPYYLSPKRLCSSLFEEPTQFECTDKVPSEMCEESKGTHLRSEDSIMNTESNSKNFVPCALTDKFLSYKNRSPQKSSKLVPQVIFETEVFSSDVDVEKGVEGTVMSLNLPSSNELGSNEMMLSISSNVKACSSESVFSPHTAVQKQMRTLQGYDMNENTTKADISSADVCSPIKPPSVLDFHTVDETAAGEILDVAPAETGNCEDQLFTFDGNLTTDIFASGSIFKTSKAEPLLGMRNSDFPAEDDDLSQNALHTDVDCSKSVETAPDKHHRNLKFLCCLETENKESVKRMHILTTAEEVLIVIQCDTVIQIWKKIAEDEWMKIGIYHTEKMTSIEKSCMLTKGEYVIFVLLICTNEGLSLKFLTFDKSLQVIQVIESSNFKRDRYNERTRLMLCELEGLTFATAEGEECFSVDIHFVENADNEPFLWSRKLGNLSDCLLGLSGVQNAPKAVMGWSMESLYVWNYVSGNLVTIVNLMPRPLNPYNKCLWATSEEGLLFLLMTSGHRSCLDSCQLIAVNPMTGLWDIIQCFCHSSHEESKTTDKFIDGIVLGRNVILTCCQSSYLWDLYTGSNTASLIDCDVTSVTCGHNILAIGLQSGCTNLYSFY